MKEPQKPVKLSYSVLSEEQAFKKYNEKGKNGAVIITTKDK